MPRKAEQDWYQKSAERMVREGKSLAQVCIELELPVTPREAENVQRTKAFQAILWAERHKFHKELAGDPNRSKSTAVGNLQYLVQKLMEQGEWLKAADVIFKMAKIEGWVGSESNVNIFAGLKSKDLDELEKQIESAANAGGAVKTGSRSRTGVN